MHSLSKSRAIDDNEIKNNEKKGIEIFFFINLYLELIFVFERKIKLWRNFWKFFNVLRQVWGWKSKRDFILLKEVSPQFKRTLKTIQNFPCKTEIFLLICLSSNIFSWVGLRKWMTKRDGESFSWKLIFYAPNHGLLITAKKVSFNGEIVSNPWSQISSMKVE